MTHDVSCFQECPGCASSIQGCAVLFATTLFGRTCNVLKCGACGLVFKEIYPKDLGDLYAADYVHFAQTHAPAGAAEIISARQKLRRCQRFIAIDKPASVIRVLDIGCGSGQFVRIARSLGYDAQGIDPFLPDHQIEAGITRNSPEDLPPASYDVVTLLNVAEHVADPVAIFTAVGALIRPGGVLLVTCPYGDSWARRYYKARWTHLALDEHLLFWTPASLAAALGRSGISGKAKIRIAGSPFPYGLDEDNFVRSSSTAESGVTNAPSRSRSLQTRVWRMARQLQEHEAIGNSVRALVNMSGLGDYLEVVTRVPAT